MIIEYLSVKLRNRVQLASFTWKFTSRTLGCIENSLLDFRDKVLSERYYTKLLYNKTLNTINVQSV